MQGRKMRAPVLGKDSLCQHSVRNIAGGIELVLDCEGCGRGNLAMPRCYKGVINAIRLRGFADAIILRSHIERRQNSISTRAMNQIVEIIGLLEELESQSLHDSKRNNRCGECLSSFLNGIGDMKSGLMNRDIQLSSQRVQNLIEYEFKSGVRCHECAGMAKLNIERISGMMGELEKLILAGRFRIVSVGE